MRRIVRGLVLASFVLAVLPAAAFAGENEEDVYDCGKPNCTKWAPKGENTCRSCETTQCRKQGDKELLVGSKTRNECYQGHGAPPSDEELKK
jgi:uncharacterized membrane protein